jgi:AcrR family transcriptional regulator
MSDAVKTPRKYDAAGRREQARRTRRLVLAAAHDLFLADGYSATTIPLVARAAGVSPQSVYKSFGNKAGLVKAVFDVTMAGDDEPVTMLERESLTRVRAEPDPYVKLRLYADFVAGTAPRHVPVQLLLRTAAGTDAEAAAVWSQLSDERLRGLAMFAQALAPVLRPEVTVEQARDLLWAYNSPELWDLLVTQRGWSPQQYATQLARSLISALLP